MQTGKSRSHRAVDGRAILGMVFFNVLTAIACLLFALTSLQAQSSAVRTAATADYLRLPLSFEANQGQADAQTRFVSRGPGYTLSLTDSQAILSLNRLVSNTSSVRTPGSGKQPEEAQASAIEKEVVRLQFLKANSHALATGFEQLPGKDNYYIGNDRSKWRAGIPTYARVKYQSIYPGIDLVYYGNQSQLEYDFVVSPGADANSIRFSVSESNTPTRLEVNHNGDLIVHGNDRDLRLMKPVLYQQDRNGDRVLVAGGYILNRDGEVGFAVGGYDKDKPLVIDPILSYSTYLGAAVFEYGPALALDSSTNIYVTGATTSTTFPTANALQGTLQVNSAGGEDCFISKIKSDGSALAYSTYLGGTGADRCVGIAVDSNANAYVIGTTTSTDFPTHNALQNSYAGGADDVIVAKINADGSLGYSTYLGGSLDDYAGGIAVDGAGNAYISGGTSSSDFPTTSNVFQGVHAGVVNGQGVALNTYTPNYDAFVTKIAPDGSSLVYSTFLGGSPSCPDSDTIRTCGSDAASGIAIDTLGNAYVVGNSESENFPTVNAAQPTNNLDSNPIYDSGDIFISKLSADGSALLYSTFLGGTGADNAGAIAVDNAGNVFVGGASFSTDFPLKNNIIAAEPPGGDNGYACVAKIDTGLTGPGSLLFSTCFGGFTTGNDGANGVALDASGDPYFVGFTNSNLFPITSNALQPTFPGSTSPNISYAAFVIKFSSDGSQLLYSSYLGGSAYSTGTGIAVTGGGTVIPVVYVTGLTESTNFPVTSNAIQKTIPASESAFVSKISFRPVLKLPGLTVASPIFLGGSGSATITVTSMDEIVGPFTFDVSSVPVGITVTPAIFQLAPAPNGSASQPLSIMVGPSVIPATYTFSVAEQGVATSIPVTVNVPATTAGIDQVLTQLQADNCMANPSVSKGLTTELNAEQGLVNAGHSQAAIDAYALTLLEVAALRLTNFIHASCSAAGFAFDPTVSLAGDIRGLMANLKPGATANPVSGYVVDSHDVGVAGAKVSLTDSSGHVLSTATTDLTGFYYFPSSGLSASSNYTVRVTSFSKLFKTATPASQPFTWNSAAVLLQNFVLN